MTDQPVLEPLAETILTELLRHARDSGLEPVNVPDSAVHALSAAISAKRSADALERIADAAENSAEAMNVNGEWSIPASLHRIAQALRK